MAISIKLDPLSLSLSLFTESFAICRLPADAPPPAWAITGDWFALTRTYDELSIVCAEQAVPADVQHVGGWRAFKVDGPLDFGLTGVLVALAAPLAEAGISIFAVSTYDTDYVLVRAHDADRAGEVLRAAGHTIREIKPVMP